MQQKCSLLVEKQKDFSFLKRIDLQPETEQFDLGRLVRSARQNFLASKLKVNFFVLLRVALLVLQA